MSATYGTWLAILWWIFTIIFIFGILLLKLDPANAFVAVGCSGLVFVAFCALLHLRDQS